VGGIRFGFFGGVAPEGRVCGCGCSHVYNIILEIRYN
jgi:hypothetical protein